MNRIFILIALILGLKGTLSAQFVETSILNYNPEIVNPAFVQTKDVWEATFFSKLYNSNEGFGTQCYGSISHGLKNGKSALQFSSSYKTNLDQAFQSSLFYVRLFRFTEKLKLKLGIGFDFTSQYKASYNHTNEEIFKNSYTALNSVVGVNVMVKNLTIGLATNGIESKFLDYNYNLNSKFLFGFPMIKYTELHFKYDFHKSKKFSYSPSVRFMYIYNQIKTNIHNELLLNYKFGLGVSYDNFDVYQNYYNSIRAFEKGHQANQFSFSASYLHNDKAKFLILLTPKDKRVNSTSCYLQVKYAF